jgi:hypothetical protein
MLSPHSGDRGRLAGRTVGDLARRLVGRGLGEGAALNVFFREQNGRLEDTSDRSYGDELYYRERPNSDIQSRIKMAPEEVLLLML